MSLGRVLVRNTPARSGSCCRTRSSRAALNHFRGLSEYPRGLDRAVESAFLSDARTRLPNRAARGARHGPHIEVLDPDHVEPPCEVGGGLLHPVRAPVLVAGFEPCDRAFSLLAVLGPALGSGEPLLQRLQPLRLTLGQTRRTQELTGGQRGGHDNASIDTNYAAITRTGERSGDVSERDMPAAGAITGNSIRLHPLRHRPRQVKPHPAHLHPRPRPKPAPRSRRGAPARSPRCPGWSPRRPSSCDPHAGPLRDRLNTLQLRSANPARHPIEPGLGPGEKYTGPVW